MMRIISLYGFFGEAWSLHEISTGGVAGVAESNNCTPPIPAIHG